MRRCAHVTCETNSISPENSLRKCFTYAKEEMHSLSIVCGTIVITIPDNSSENFILNFTRILWMVIMVHCFRPLHPLHTQEKVNAASPFIIIDDKPSHHLPSWRWLHSFSKVKWFHLIDSYFIFVLAHVMGARTMGAKRKMLISNILQLLAHRNYHRMR